MKTQWPWYGVLCYITFYVASSHTHTVTIFLIMGYFSFCCIIIFYTLIFKTHVGTSFSISFRIINYNTL